MLYWFSSHSSQALLTYSRHSKVSCPDSVDSHLAGFCRTRTCLSGFAKILHPSFHCYLWKDIFLLPHFLLYSLLQMRHSRYFIPDTHMRSAMVIEMYVASYDISCMPDVVEPASRMAAFRLNNPVDTFRNGIVGGFVVFRHTDGNAMFLKKCHIWVATVLYATV